MKPTRHATTSLVLLLTFLHASFCEAADFGVRKLLGGKAAAEVVAPKLSYRMEGAPTDNVELIFFYGKATKTLLTAANDKNGEVVKNLGEQLKVKVANLTAQEQAKAFEEVAASSLTEQQKVAVGHAWRDLLASNLLAANAAAAAQALVASAPGVPPAVQANKLKYGLKGAGYIKDTPGLITDLQGIVTETPKFLAGNGAITAAVAKLGSAAGIQQPTAEQSKKGAEEVATAATKKVVSLGTIE